MTRRLRQEAQYDNKKNPQPMITRKALSSLRLLLVAVSLLGRCASSSVSHTAPSPRQSHTGTVAPQIGSSRPLILPFVEPPRVLTDEEVAECASKIVAII